MVTGLEVPLLIWEVPLLIWWVGGNQVKNHATSWSNLQDCKISSRAEIPKLDPSVAIIKYVFFKHSHIYRRIPAVVIMMYCLETPTVC